MVFSCQSETIELTGFDDKIVEEDHKGQKEQWTASLKRGILECNGGVAEEDEVEVPRDVILPEQSPGEFDYNKFFNLDKVPCMASMIKDVLRKETVSASHISRWFSNPSWSGRKSSRLGPTHLEELERLVA